jgi:hypothetical protein
MTILFFFKKKYAENYDCELTSKHHGYVFGISAVVLLLASSVYKVFFSFDPLDSNFITYELCINITSFYGFKNIKKVLSRSYFENFIEDEIDKKYKEKAKNIL